MTHAIHMDGRRLVGTAWVRPSDWQEADVAAGLLPAMKGATPESLPELGEPTDSVVTSPWSDTLSISDTTRQPEGTENE